MHPLARNAAMPVAGAALLLLALASMPRLAQAQIGAT